MSITPATRGAFFVDDVFGNTGSSRILKNANAYFEDSETGGNTQMDSVVLYVFDAEGSDEDLTTAEYTLTTLSTPAVQIESVSGVYYVSEIDVTGFIDGDITLHWVGTLDGYTYELNQTVAFDAAPTMIFVSGHTATLESFDVTLDTAKVFNTRIVDTAENPVDGYAARLVIYDRVTGSNVTTSTADYVGDGLWSTEITLSSGTYSADHDRYEIFWQAQTSDGGTWFDVENTRHAIDVNQSSTFYKSGRITYNTNQSVRFTFPGIDFYLEQVVTNQAERELWLNQKRWEASTLIYEHIKNTRKRMSRDILQLWADWETVRRVLITAKSFAKSAAIDTQLVEIEKEIKRIKATLNAGISTVRIGPRSPSPHRFQG